MARVRYTIFCCLESFPQVQFYGIFEAIEVKQCTAVGYWGLRKSNIQLWFYVLMVIFRLEMDLNQQLSLKNQYIWKWWHALNVAATAQRCVFPVSFQVNLPIIPPERKLTKRTSVHCGGLVCPTSTMAAIVVHASR